MYLNGTPRTPWAQMALFRRVSILTSWNMDDFMNEPIECVHVTDLGSHLLLSKLLDLLDSPGRLVLEPDSMQPLVHVDRVLACNDL